MERNRYGRALVVLVFSLALMGSGLVATNVSAAAPITLTILHSNDGDSELISLPGQPEWGGVARFKYLVDDARANWGGTAILVSSGDMFLDSPEFGASRSMGAPFFEAIAAEALGYDAIAFGNNDFDFGPSVLADFIGGFTVTKPPVWLGANMDVSAEPALSPLEADGTIATRTTISVAGEDIGLVGLNTPTLVDPGGVIVAPDLAAQVQREVDLLVGAGVDKIILLSHLLDIDNEVALAAELSGVDVIVAGGGRELLANPGDTLFPGDSIDDAYPVLAKDKDGVDVPVVTTSGGFAYLGVLHVTFDAAGKVTGWGGGPEAAWGVSVDPDMYAAVTAPLSTRLSGADIAELYTFTGANPDATVLAMTVSPAAGAAQPHTFGTDVVYQLNIVATPTDPSPFGFKADTAFRATFGSPDAYGNQAFDLYRSDGPAADGHDLYPSDLILSGTTNEITSFDTAAGPGTGKFFAGLRSDPSFLDLAAWRGWAGEASNGRTFGDGMATDFFDGADVMALVLELPDVALPAQAPDLSSGLALWGSTFDDSSWSGQADRIGRPLFNMVVNSNGSVVDAGPGAKESFVTRHPGDDSIFILPFQNALEALSSGDDEGPFSSQFLDFWADVFLPDILHFNKHATASPPFNGRRLEDDAVDVMLNIVTGGDPFLFLPERDVSGAVGADGIGPHTDYLSVFPYLGEPNRQLPIANPDFYLTPFETLLEASSVLDNDDNPAGGFMFAIKDSDPAVGHLDFFTSGAFRYTPPAGFSGDVTFEYHIDVDGVASAPAPVTITVGDGPTGTGTVDGTVLLDGVPLQDVEVWLAEGFGTGSQANHYTCTDDAGSFSFDGIASGVPLVAATGPSVSAGCANDEFRDPATGALLQVQFYDHQHVLEMADVFTLGPTPKSAMPSPRAAMTIAFDVLYQGINIGMVDTSQGLWHMRAPFGEWDEVFYFGDPGDVPFVGDWDCDGVATPGLFRLSDAYAYLRNSNTVGIADIKFFFGDPNDIPLSGDFNGDGCDTLSLYRPSEQRFYISNKLGENNGGLGPADYWFSFGNPGDTPFVGDFDGDGIDEVGLHRSTTGLVYFEDELVENGGGGSADHQFIFGDPGDRFVAGDWIANGFDAPGVFRPADATWYLKFQNVQGNADAVIPYGESPWLPVAGFWGLPKVAP